jgi:hypothetical protein
MGTPASNLQVATQPSRSGTMSKISVACVYFRDGEIARIANDFAAQGADIHLWALDEVLPSVEKWTRGVGKVEKNENLNKLAEFCAEADYVLFSDDDILYPPNFLTRYFEYVERYKFDLAQPALTLDSDHSWALTLAREDLIARRTNWVEQMVFSMSRRMLKEAMPGPPDFWMGWGIEIVWERILRNKCWYAGIIDALPVNHGRVRPIGKRYSVENALEKMILALNKHNLKFIPPVTLQRWSASGEVSVNPKVEHFLKHINANDLRAQSWFSERQREGSPETALRDGVSNQYDAELPKQVLHHWLLIKQIQLHYGLDASTLPDLKNPHEAIGFILETMSELDAIRCN